MIKHCPNNCYSPFQDEKYGKGKRVHTLSAKKPGQEPEARCTVCSGPPRWIQRLIAHARLWAPHCG